jgi:hypothetical protein
LELNNRVLGGYEQPHGVVKSVLRSSLGTALKVWHQLPSLYARADEGAQARHGVPPNP